MMASLMSVFDPSSTLLGVSLPLKALVQLILMAFLLNSIWAIPSGVSALVKVIYTWAKSLGLPFLLCWLFQFILFSNLMGLLPATYTFPSSLQFSLSLSVSLWLGGVIYSITLSVNNVLAHLCPEGVEGLMSIFLVSIELISLLIRPMSLGIRLMANLTAGHMIMALCESGFSLQGAGVISSSLSLVSLCLISLFEIAVAVVQAYIFVNLMSLYWEES
uniref:ATP synthase subunit a n=1 Tax=Hoplopleura akanezumi TaxID=1511645 RepID=A0A075EB42_9NEOP|nr:ATP synthase subunit 6 [Hoplopleura akanezumi]